MAEEKRNIQIVGNYSIRQGEPEDCKVCHDAIFATVIIDGVCVDCLQATIRGYKDELKML